MKNQNYHSYITPINEPQIIPPYQQQHATQIRPHSSVEMESDQSYQIYLPPQLCPANTGPSNLFPSSIQSLFPLMLPKAQKQTILSKPPQPLPQDVPSSSYNKEYHQTHSQPHNTPNVEFPVSYFDSCNDNLPTNYYSYNSPILQPQQVNRAPDHPAQIESHPSVQKSKFWFPPFLGYTANVW